MPDVIASQIRWYHINGNYAHTTAVIHTPGSNNNLQEIFGYEAPGMKPVHPCNIMIRRNGKLVSYKDFQ